MILKTMAFKVADLVKNLASSRNAKCSLSFCIDREVLTDYAESWEHFWGSTEVQRMLPLPMQAAYKKRKQEAEANWYRPLDPVPSDEETKNMVKLRQSKRRNKKIAPMDPPPKKNVESPNVAIKVATQP